MAFELEHDWQGNLAIPRARIGENVKTRLLIILCAIWIGMGLISHAPWKPDESLSISIIKSMLEGGSLLVPVVAGQASIENPPLYYLSAVGLAKVLSPISSILPMHDAARLVTGLWMAITLLMVGMTGRELWGRGVGRQTTLIFLGSLGLIVTAHMLMPEVSALTGCAMGLYALALAKRRPFRASLLLGSGIGISFLSTGMLSALVTITSALLLPALFNSWRTRSYTIVLGLAALSASPWLFLWPLLCWQAAPDLLGAWWQNSVDGLSRIGNNHLYFLRTAGWFTWPALPLAIWALWRFRRYLLQKPKFQLLIVFFIVSFILTGLGADSREIYALPLLLPLTGLAGGAVETLKRGAAGALNWFGIILFGLIAFLVWLGWIAAMTGWPAKLATRMQVLSGTTDAHFSLLAFLTATGITVIWLLVITNAKRSNRAAVNDWAVGITMAWTLLMTLWLPWIDSAKSYESVMSSLQKVIPENHACINSKNLGESQHALLYYYTNLHTQPLETGQRLDCDLYLIQDERGRETIEPGSDWKLIWQDRRPADRRESFRLFRRIS